MSYDTKNLLLLKIRSDNVLSAGGLSKSLAHLFGSMFSEEK